MKDKREVRDFYDQVGWQKAGEGLYADAVQFEDLRPVSRDYIHKCHLRVTRYLKPAGKYFLDVASGPIQYPEYLTYSNNFETRICVDISLLALQEARRKLGSKGAYVLADVAHLPLKDCSVDGAVSLHTIYHVPEDEQHLALREIHRVLKPGATAAVVYSWGSHSPLMNLLLSPPIMVQKLKACAIRFVGKRHGMPTANTAHAPLQKLYFHAHDYTYFANQAWGFDFNISVWRSVSVPFTKRYVHGWLLGRQILSLIYWLEDRFPHAAGRLGQYPLFIIKK